MTFGRLASASRGDEIRDERDVMLIREWCYNFIRKKN